MPLPTCTIEVVLDDGRILSTLYTEPGIEAMLAAKGLSVGFPKQEIHVSMLGKLRRVYKDNQVLATYCLYKYLARPTPEELAIWSMNGLDEH